MEWHRMASEWHPFFLKNLSDVLSIPLAILFNKSLTERAHESWKKAFISPIFKKGKKSDPSNYRPVSLTSVRFQRLWSRLLETKLFRI